MLIHHRTRHFLIIFLFLITSCATAHAGTIYVAGDGSGNYNCDGADDHIEINSALQYAAANPGTTVHLKGPFTYSIDQTLRIGNDTILEGDSNVVLKLADNAGWNTWTPLIGQAKSITRNITVQGFAVDVNYNKNSIGWGKGYYNVVQISHCNGININNMYMDNGAGDGARLTECTNVLFYNNKIRRMGHDGLFTVRCNGVEAWNNDISARDNSALRIWNCEHVSFHDNLIYAESDAYCGPGIQVEKSTTTPMSDIRVYNNTIRDIYGPGVWIIGYGQSYMTRNEDGIQIYHNIFYNDGLNTGINWVGGVVVDGFHNVQVYENIFDKTRGAAVLGMQAENAFIPLSYSCKVIVKDNIITNSVAAGYSKNSGYGVENRIGSYCTFEISGNCIYNCNIANYKNVNTPTTDIYADPLFVNAANFNYQLQSTSPMKKLIGIPIGFQGFTSSRTNGYYPASTVTMDFVDPNLTEATTQDMYKYRLYLDEQYAGKYKNLTMAEIGGKTSKIRYNNPVIAMLVAYASAAHDPNINVAEYIPSMSSNAITGIYNTTSGNGVGVIYNINNATNCDITNYNNCNVTNITNIDIDSHDSYNYDSHDTYYHNNTTINIYYQNNTTIVNNYYSSPEHKATNDSSTILI